LARDLRRDWGQRVAPRRRSYDFSTGPPVGAWPETRL